MEIYRHESYRDLVQALIDESEDRGVRSRLAEAASCSPSWVSRALSGTVQLTPDQALAVANYFRLNENEIEFLLALVELERAATPLLRKRIRRRIDQLRFDAKGAGLFVKTEDSVSEEHATRYYSSWVYAAIHVATMIDRLSIVELASRLRIDERAMETALEKLAEMGLVVAKAGKWEATPKNVHLSSKHQMANLAHVGLRNRTIQFLQENPDQSSGFHYSAVHCLSRVDSDRIRTILKETTMAVRKVIEPSKEETLAVFCVDWYEL
jgi:uncharacterized protein (TIGR02147 family)